MKKIWGLFIICSILLGCSAPTQKFIKSESQYIYRKIVVMPFTPTSGRYQVLAHDTFLQELSAMKEIELIGRGQVNNQVMSDLGLTDQESFSAVDFIADEQGAQRRTRIDELLAPKAVIFADLAVDNNKAFLSVEMLNMENNALTLSFSKEEQIYEGKIDEAVKAVATECAQKVANHIKDNVTITNIYKYF